MTNQAYAELISQLPESTLKEYGFCRPFDFSQHECIHTTGFDYYPKLNCVVIDNVPIVWHEDIPCADPRKPKHLREFKRIAGIRNRITLAAISISTNGKMYCLDYIPNEMVYRHIRKAGFTALPLKSEEGDIYYIPDEIDLPNNPEMLLLAKCLFMAKKYNAIHILPEPNVNPRLWEDIIYVPDEDDTGMLKIFEKDNYAPLNVTFDRKNHIFTRIS